MEEENNPIQEPGAKKEETREAQTTQNVGPKKQNNFALVSFILSLVGLIIAGLPCGIVAVVLGIISLVKFDATKEKGKGFGIAGLAIGIFDAVGAIIIILRTVATLA